MSSAYIYGTSSVNKLRYKKFDSHLRCVDIYLMSKWESEEQKNRKSNNLSIAYCLTETDITKRMMRLKVLDVDTILKGNHYNRNACISKYQKIHIHPQSKEN